MLEYNRETIEKCPVTGAFQRKASKQRGMTNSLANLKNEQPGISRCQSQVQDVLSNSWIGDIQDIRSAHSSVLSASARYPLAPFKQAIHDYQIQLRNAQTHPRHSLPPHQSDLFSASHHLPNPQPCTSLTHVLFPSSLRPGSWKVEG